MDKDNEVKLFVAKYSDYKDKYQDHLFQQYKLYIESVEKISDRRQESNKYFLTINTALLSLFGLSSKIDFIENGVELRLVIAILGCIISLIFWFLLRSYRQLNTGKFKVIHEIEQKLPVALYGYEWGELQEGKNWKVYFPFSHIELFIPSMFFVFYFVLIIFYI